MRSPSLINLLEPLAARLFPRRKNLTKSPGRLFGDSGEQEAARFLKRQGYEILDRNVDMKVGELDIIALDGTCLCFVEVKTRKKQDGPFHPGANLTPKKKSNLSRAARRYVRKRKLFHLPLRYDFVGIVMEDGASPQIKHVKDFWRP